MAYFIFYSQLLPLTLILVLKMSAYYICCVYSRTTTCTTFYYGSNTMNPDQGKVNLSKKGFRDQKGTIARDAT